MGEGGGFGWGGVEGWGEKADNCNWITIKIKKKSHFACSGRKVWGQTGVCTGGPTRKLLQKLRQGMTGAWSKVAVAQRGRNQIQEISLRQTG